MLRSRLRRGPGLRIGAGWIVALALLATYSALAGRPVWAQAARFAVYGLVVIGAALTLPRARPLKAPWRLFATLVLLWAPLEFGWVGGLRLPAAHGLDLSPLLAIDLALVLFLAARPVPDIGFTFSWRGREIATAALAFVAFAVIAIPAGFAIGFLHYGWRPFDPLQWTTTLLSIYFFTAIPEELLFRGLIQNTIEKLRPGAKWRLASLVIAAVIFGASHLDNPPVPNIRYACLATVAGLAYGAVWIRTRKVTVSALTHAAVDIVWVLVLGGGH
jgi:membrane protease YdiL (CAAX protease family)